MKKKIYEISAGITIIVGMMILISTFQTQEKQPERQQEMEKKITFAAFGDLEYQSMLEEIIAVFYEKTGIKTEIFCFSTQSELEENILKQFTKGEPYDVFMTQRDFLYHLEDGEWIANLKSVIKQRKKEGDEYYEYALREGEVRGAIYALPVGMNPYVLICNEDLLEECGMDSVHQCVRDNEWNFDTFCSYIEKTYEQQKCPSFLFESEVYIWQNLLSMEGGCVICENENIQLDVLAQQTEKKISKLIEEGKIQEIDGYVNGKRKEEIFLEGKLPFIYGDLEDMRTLGDSDFDWDIIPIPSISGDFSNSEVQIPLIAASAEGKLETALSFIDFYVSAQGQQLRLEYGECLFPSINTVYYTGKEAIYLPEHSNYFIYAIEQGYSGAYRLGKRIKKEDFFNIISKTEE